MKINQNPTGRFIDELEFSQSVKKVLKILTWIIPLIVAGFVIYYAFIESEEKKREREINTTLEFSFQGIVKEKYISWNHNTPTTKLYGGQEIGSDYGLYNLVQINDSLSKEKGVLYINVYRKENPSTNYVFLKKEYFHILDRKTKLD